MNTIEKIQFTLAYLFKASIFLLVFLALWQREYFLAASSIFVLFLMFLPAIVGRSARINMPVDIDFVLSLIMWLHFALGEYNGFYIKLWWWDILLHSANSIVMALVGFVFAYALLLTSRIKAKPFFISLFAVTFSVFTGVIWEIFEFSMDQLFGFNMQKSGLVDTMGDLMVDVAGAVAVSALGLVYLRKPRPGFVHSLLAKFVHSHIYQKVRCTGRRLRNVANPKS